MDDWEPEGRRDEGDYFICPQCGKKVEADARACPHCGSDEETGWAEEADKWEGDIPAGYGADDDFDYDEFVAREFPQQADGEAPRLTLAFFVALAVAAAVLAITLALILSE